MGDNRVMIIIYGAFPFSADIDTACGDEEGLWLWWLMDHGYFSYESIFVVKLCLVRVVGLPSQERPVGEHGCYLNLNMSLAIMNNALSSRSSLKIDDRSLIPIGRLSGHKFSTKHVHTHDEETLFSQ